MKSVSKDLCRAAAVACVITAISTAVLVTSFKAEISSPIQRLSSLVSYVAAPGALLGVVLAILATGNYGTRGTFIVTFAAIFNLIFYGLVAFGGIRLFLYFASKTKRNPTKQKA